MTEPFARALPCTGIVRTTTRRESDCGRTAYYSHQNKIGWVYKCTRKGKGTHFFTIPFPPPTSSYVPTGGND